MATSNSTFEFMDGEDPFSTLDLTKVAEEVSENRGYDIYDIWNIIAFLIRFVVCAASLGASIFLIYVFIKFKNLRKGSNVYFLYYSICNVIDMFFIPFYSLIHELVLISLIGYLPLCIVFQLNAIILTLEVCLITSVAIDWYLVIVNNKLVDNYERFQNILIIGLNTVFTILFIILTADCFLDFSVFSDYSGIIVYIISMLIILIINCLIYRKQLTSDQLKSKYLLNISTLFTLASLPSFVIYLIWIFVPPENNTGVIMLLDIIETFAEILTYSTSIILVYLLGYYNKYFKMAYDSILKRSIKTYQQDNLDGSGNEAGTGTTTATTTNQTNNNVNRPTLTSSNIIVDC